jgi:hypothetical protein
MLIGKPVWKIPPERPRRRYENNIKMELKKDDTRVWIGFMLFRIEMNGGLL